MTLGGKYTAATVLVSAGVLFAVEAMAQDPGWREIAVREAQRARELQRAELLREQYERRRAAAHARMRSEEDAGTLYASTLSPADTQLSCPAEPVAHTPSVFDSIFSERADGTLLISIGDGRPTEAGRGDTGVAPPYWPATLPAVPQPSPAFDFAAAHADLLNLGVRDGVGSAGTAAPHGIPLFPAASDAHGRQGIAQVLNRSALPGVVRVDAVDDTGRRYGPLALFVEANGTVQIDSDDLENGNEDKGLFGGTGPGVGDWRLELSSGLDIEALSYVRSWDGVVSAMHDTVPIAGTSHRVPIFNPASDWDRESRLRLINPGAGPAEVAITGIDSHGHTPGTGVSVTIPAGASLTYTASELESGRRAGLRGLLGDGTGAWQLVVSSGQPLTVMNLLASPTGHLTNLSTVPLNESQGVHGVPLFPAASDPSGSQGLVRVINRTGTASEVRIEAFDDTQWNYAPLVLSIGPGEAVHFDSNDLEQGNAAKGLVGGTGPGQGDWRLELSSNLDIEVLSYVRAWDGLLTSMHDVVPSEEEGAHRVSMFDAEGYQDRENRLRLINPGSMPAEVSITGVGAAGQPLGDGTTLTIPAGASRTYTAAELAAGVGAGLRGSLGGATGEWQLTVGSEQPIRVMSLFANSTGHLTNLSTAPLRVRATAPPLLGTDTDPPAAETLEDVFRTEVSPIVQAKCILCHMAGRAADEPLSRLQFSASTVEGHVALNLAVFQALIAVLEDDEQVEDPVAYILNKVQGVDHGGGAQATAGTDDYASLERFLGLLGEAVAPVGITPETLFDGVTMEPARSTLRRAAIVFAGRVPTDAEYAAVRGGSEDALRTTIRGLMTGPGFHEFLIRASNDRLLTDRELGNEVIGRDGYFVDFTNKFYELIAAAGGPDDAPEAWNWKRKVQYGAARAPSELIAHVAKNDLPYTEIITADYIMANPHAAEAYGASTEFEDANDVHEFRPSEIVSYYRDDDSKEKVVAFDKFTIFHVTDPGNLRTDYPHAGILNTTAFLLRYPTTPTNRNRARSRWTYYHFLGFDIEKSASRTTDPIALADTNNPTLNNPACTVCHVVLDPVAGAFQNYGDRGFYRDQWGGLDSLDQFYKRDFAAGSGELEVTARSPESRQTMAVEAQLPAGRTVVRFVPHFDPPKPQDSEAWWNGGFGEVRVLNSSGTVVHRLELADLDNVQKPGMDADWLCGTEKERAGVRFFEAFFCPSEFPVNVDAAGTYTVEVDVWVYTDREVGDRRRLLSMQVGVHREGDTWYRDVRSPGFDGQLAPNPDNSLQWLAQRVVADSRFAEAAVKFWWPAIMGGEVAEPPEDESDAGFEGLLLASNAQAAEVQRLAQGFRRGFQERAPYNLKDLLVEIVLSSWFRADSVADDAPVRAVALHGAGARRLLTPEELARKTLALTGFQWGRVRGQNWRPPHERQLSQLTDIRQGYGLLYGGINSDGVTDRTRDLTSVMAGVAQSHALETSRPVVLKEFFLLSDEDRRLFKGIDKTLSPAFEFGETFEIEGETRSQLETLSVVGQLPAGGVTVLLSHRNQYYEDTGNGRRRDRAILLDRVIVRSGDSVVYLLELEDLDHPVECHHIENGAFHLSTTSSECILRVPVDIPSEGTHTIEVLAWADRAGDELARLEISVESDAERSAGANAIRAKLVELYDMLHGMEVTADSPEVSSAYELFVDVWERRRADSDSDGHFLRTGLESGWSGDQHYFDGIADQLWRQELDENGNELGWDWDAIAEYFRELDLSDPDSVAWTWTVVLAYLLMDYRYLYM